MAALLDDLRFGLRLLRKSPGTTTLAVLTLALGIGANTAIFSVLDAVLLRELPMRDPKTLVVGWESYEALSGGFFAGRIPARLTSWIRWKEQCHGFQGMAGAQFGNANLNGVGRPDRIECARVSADFFDVLGVKAALGRNLTPDDERGRAVLVSHWFWKSRLGGGSNALGRSIRVDGAAYTVAGVLPNGFLPPALMEGFDQTRPDVWIPVDIQALRGRPDAAANVWVVFARLKPGVTVAQARADIRAVMARLRRVDPPTYAGWTGNLYTVREEDVGPGARRTLLLLQAAVLLVLLIACANVANLLLARVAARERELSVRRALGAGALRVARQLFVETLLLVAIGAAAGVCLAPLILKGLVAMDPAEINRPETWRLNAGVFVFTCLLAGLSAMVAACAPAVAAALKQPADALRARTAAGEGSRFTRRFLIATEVALACVLLVGAGLLIRSLRAVMSIDPGFRTDRVLTTNIDLPSYRYPAPAQQTAFCERLLERTRSLPGVESAALAAGVPLQSLSMGSYHVEGQAEPPPGKEPVADFRNVSPGYFRAMGTPLLKGRDFTRQDAAPDAAPVVIVNESFARKVWPGQDPIGKALMEGKKRAPVVGVVADTHQLRLEEPSRPEIFRPRMTYDSMVLVARTPADAARFGNVIRNEVWAIDPDQPVREIRTMSFLVKSSLSQRRFNMILLTAFAGLAALLASIGIYGVVSHSVVRRTPEIGVRMALGAQRRNVLALVLGDMIGVVGAGLAAGAAGAVAAVRLLRALLYGISQWDAASFAAAVLLLLLVASSATLSPAFRATRIEPTAALRHE